MTPDVERTTGRPPGSGPASPTTTGDTTTSGAKYVAVHFDLDVLDPGLHELLRFDKPGARTSACNRMARARMRFEQVAAIFEDVAAEAAIVGLAITENVPLSAIQLARWLKSLPPMENIKDLGHVA